MDWWHFGLLLNENTVLYLWTLLSTAIFYFVIYRKTFLSILDPLVFSVIFSAFGFSVVLFLFITKSIETKYLISYLLTQFSFFGGYFTLQSLRKNQILEYPRQLIVFVDEDLFIRILFIVCASLYIFIQLISYALVGIPLFIGTHIDLYTGAGGLGILGRLIDVLKPITIYLLIHYTFTKTSSITFYVYKNSIFFLLLIFFALSGSRSEFLTIGLIFFCYLILNGYKLGDYFKKIRRYELIILLCGLFFIFFTISFQSNNSGSDTSGLAIFLFRLVASGDAYYFSYPNGYIENLSHAKPFLALFGDIFSTLRIIPREQQPVILGYQLYQLYGQSDTIMGPNARHNVFGYVYFGFYGSILFSYILGFSLSFVRNKSFYFFRKTTLGQILFVLLYTNFAVIETDPPMIISNLENILLLLPVILIVSISSFVLISNFYKKDFDVSKIS